MSRGPPAGVEYNTDGFCSDKWEDLHSHCEKLVLMMKLRELVVGGDPLFTETVEYVTEYCLDSSIPDSARAYLLYRELTIVVNAANSRAMHPWHSVSSRRRVRDSSPIHSRFSTLGSLRASKTN